MNERSMYREYLSLESSVTQYRLIYFGILAVLTLSGCKQSQSLNNNPSSKKIVVISELQYRHTMNISEEDDSNGSITVFESLLLDSESEVVGRMNGKLVAYSMPNKNDNANRVHEDKFRTIVFTFEDAGTIIIDGVSHYPAGEPIMALNDPRETAITGGTGIYIGARGEVTTTRISETQYEHEFNLIR